MGFQLKDLSGLKGEKMNAEDKKFQQELHVEFLKTLHDEKTKTQTTRANYVSAKFAFITGLFGLGALQIGGANFHWLLFFIPLVAIGYDLYIRAEDLSIKKIGAFLRADPHAQTADSEKAWERFSAKYRDKLAQLATTLFTFIIIVAAGAYIFVLETTARSGRPGRAFIIGFIVWFALFFVGNIALWISHRMQIKKLDEIQFLDNVEE